MLPSDNFVDLTSDVWTANPDGQYETVEGGKSDPDGGTDAFRVVDRWYSDAISVQSEDHYTFSIWVKRDGGNVRLRIKDPNDLSSTIEQITLTGSNSSEGEWVRTRIAFKVPQDLSSVAIEIDAEQYGYIDQYYYQPMLNEGKLEGPYENPGASVGASQSLSLQKGGNLVSSAVQPLGPDLEAVLGSAAASIAKIETEDGKVFEPDTGTDEIGTWDSSEAYKIYAETPTSFSIEGIPLDGTEVSLGEGWNWLPYPDSTSVAINQALEPIQDDLVMVKDETGRIYRPAQGTDQIGSLQPGTAYKILLKNPVTLSYPLE
jgi:hypothetical protein